MIFKPLATLTQKTKTRFKTTAAACLIGALSTHTSAEDYEYKIIDLGVLQGYHSTAAYGLSNSTHIVGNIYREKWKDPNAFIWQNNQMTSFGTFPAETEVEAKAVNSAGVSVGHVDSDSALVQAILRESDGAIYQIGTLPNHVGSVAEGINNRRQVVGYSIDSIGWPLAILWEDGLMTNLGTLGGRYSRANAVNEVGDIVGMADTKRREEHGFILHDGTMYDLGTLGGSYSEANGINDAGQVVGNSMTSLYMSHAFLWENGHMTDLGTLGGPTSYAFDINNEGIVVGYSYTNEGEQHAFIYDVEHGMRDLNSLYSAHGPAWEAQQALAINDAGQIAAFGTRLDQIHALLIVPLRITLTGPDPGLAGMVNTISISGVEPNTTVDLYYGFEEGQHEVEGCQGTYLDIADPILATTLITDETGSAEFVTLITNSMRGTTVHLQAVDRDRCEVSNLMTHEFN